MSTTPLTPTPGTNLARWLAIAQGAFDGLPGNTARAKFAAQVAEWLTLKMAELDRTEGDSDPGAHAMDYTEAVTFWHALACREAVGS
jgi:hypothetical protein